jgi:hypothetical protein
MTIPQGQEFASEVSFLDVFWKQEAETSNSIKAQGVTGL